MKAVVAAFNQEKALVGAFSVITNLRMELFQALIRAPSWAAARWPPVLWEPGDSASQCHGVLNISEISPPSILWQQPAVTCDSFYLHSALHCTPFCNAIRVPQFGLDNLINTKVSQKGIGKLCLRNYIWIIVWFDTIRQNVPLWGSRLQGFQ